MVTIEQMAEAALEKDNLLLRSLAQDFLQGRPLLNQYPRQRVADQRLLAIAASLIELFATRLKQQPPAWTKEIGAVPEPIFLVKSAATMKRLRELCETQSPEPLRKRGLLAPPNFLEFA